MPISGPVDGVNIGLKRATPQRPNGPPSYFLPPYFFIMNRAGTLLDVRWFSFERRLGCEKVLRKYAIYKLTQ